MISHNMSASEVVTQLRVQVEATTGLTISAGIAPNKMLAKVGLISEARLSLA
jgi:DNA polymerase kappa